MWIMKNYLQLRKEELKKRGAKGFTLMEMLIVVAIIAILVAIAIPLFTGQLERAREATDMANVRSAYTEVVAAYVTNGSGTTVEVPAQQTQASWQTPGAGVLNTMTVNGSGSDVEGTVSFEAKTGSDAYNVSIDDSGSFSIS